MPSRTSDANLKFRAFSDPTRLRILHLLTEGEMCVCDIVDIVEVPQPTASRHLGYLRKAGLVTTEKRGLWTYYSLVPPQTGFHTKLLDCLGSCFGEVAEIRGDKARRKKSKSSSKCC